MDSKVRLSLWRERETLLHEMHTLSVRLEECNKEVGVIENQLNCTHKEVVDSDNTNKLSDLNYPDR